MKAKDYLSQALWLDQKINIKLEQLEVLRALATKVSANLREEKVCGGNSARSHMENTVVKIVDLEREINEDIDRLVDLKTEIHGAIKQVDDVISQILLEMRYVNGRSWEDIINALGYDRSTIFRLHGRSLKEIDAIYKSET